MSKKPAKEERSARNFVVRARVSEEERQAIAEKAREAGLTVSEYARRAAIDGEVTIKSAPSVNAEAVRLLLITGNNLNQLNRRMNAGQSVSSVAVNDTLAEVQDVIRRLTK